MVLLFRKSGEIIRGRKSPTRERDDQFTRAKNLRCAGLGRACRPLRTVAASGLSISAASPKSRFAFACSGPEKRLHGQTSPNFNRAGPPTSSAAALFDQRLGGADPALDRKSTRLNSSHTVISYAVFCL